MLVLVAAMGVGLYRATHTMGIGEELAPWSQSLVAAGPMGLSSLGSAEYMYRLRDGSSLVDFSYWWLVLPAIASHLGLMGWYLWRFGRPNFLPARGSEAARSGGSLPLTTLPPRRSQFSAIV